MAIERPSGLHTTPVTPAPPGRYSENDVAPPVARSMIAKPSPLPFPTTSCAPVGSKAIACPPGRSWNARTSPVSSVSTRTTPPSSLGHAAANSIPSLLNDAATAPEPSPLVIVDDNVPVAASTTRTAPSRCVVPSRRPVASHSTLDGSEPSVTIERTTSPVDASRISTAALPAGPSAAKTSPLGLQSTRPPTPCTRRSIREAVMARWSAFSAAHATGPSSSPARSTAAMARSTLRSGSTSTLAKAPAASSRTVALATLRRRPVRLCDGDRSNGHGRNEQRRDRDQERPEPTVLPGIALGPDGEFAVLRDVALARCVEEGPLDVGQRRVGGSLPLQCSLQPGSSVELAVGASVGVPAICCDHEVTEDALSAHIVVEPGPESRPGPGEGLVGELERLVLSGHQPRLHEQRNHPVTVRIAEHGTARHSTAHRLTVERRGDQAQQDRPKRVALIGRQAVIQPVRGAGDGTADPSRAAIPVNGQRVGLAPGPRLDQRVGQQRQASRLALAVTNQQLDQSWLQTQPRQRGRLLDRRSAGRRRPTGRAGATHARRAAAAPHWC